ncbi:hypothetical protein [Demequina maris]|uniref:hypothetical protein n=1 Tax=Demequina maris TaxID=1638982 RepID=UPI00078081B1|nr:hypothetical protein [Demequina maris]
MTDAPSRGTNPWADIVGTIYTADAFLRELRLTPAEVDEAARDLHILQLETADGHHVYPTFQVVNGHLIPGLSEVLDTLQRGIDDPWTWAQWLCTYVDGALGSHRARRRHIDALVAGDVAAVARAARAAADSWAS